MHPAIARWIEADRRYDEVVKAAEDDRHAAWEEAMEASPDLSRLRPARPADAVVGAILWYHHKAGPAEPVERYSWLRVDVADSPTTGAFQSDGANYPYLDNLFVEADAPRPER